MAQPAPLSKHEALVPHAGLFVRETHKGRSLFTRTGHRAGETLFEHQGQRLTFTQAAGLPQEHIMEIGENLVVTASGNIDDFINHSCEPNCRVEFRPDGRAMSVALRDIAPGEELTFDYATTTTREGLQAFPAWRFACACGTPACRGEVSCAEEIAAARLREYVLQGLLAPHVLRKVRDLL